MDLIRTTGLTFSYNRKKRDIKNLNLKVPKGSIYGFLGRNGSGKTTTIRLLLGLLSPDDGEVMILGRSIRKHRISCLSRMGALIENPSLYEHLSGKENLSILASCYKNVKPERIQEVLRLVDLEVFGRKKVRDYSLGMKQRLGLACCLLHQPELLILDEPTNGLDPHGILGIRRLLKDLNEKEGITVLVSSHLLSEVEKLCTHYGIIRDGEMVYQGAAEDFLNSRDRKIEIELETNDLKKTNMIVQDLTLRTPIFINNHLLVSLKEKNEIPSLIDALRSNDIDIFELKIKNDLEKFFLDQTQNLYE